MTTTYIKRPFTDAERKVLNDYDREYMNRLNAMNIVSVLGLERARNDNKNGPNYICPICKNGTGSDGTGSAHVKNNKIKCYGAGLCFGEHHEDVLEALRIIEGGTIKDVLRRHFSDYDPGQALKQARADGRLPSASASHFAAEVFSENPSSFPEGSAMEWDGTISSESEPPQQPTAPAPASAPPQSSAPAPAPEPTPPPSQEPYYKTCFKASINARCMGYVQSRGFTAEQADKWGFMYDSRRDRLVIPVTECFYLARALSEASAKKYGKYIQPSGVGIAIFNLEALDLAEPVFITEGTLDAISVIEAGKAPAISINSANDVGQFIEIIKQRYGTGAPFPLMLISLDNDQAGQKATADLVKVLEELRLPYRLANILDDYHDANDRFVKDREGLRQAVEGAVRSSYRPNNTADYALNSFIDDIISFKTQGMKPTGFIDYDLTYGGIYAGLYTIGAISSLGKTTFCHQLGEQLAARGEHVLFFSLEQSRFELVAKSVSRAMARRDLGSAISNIEIRTGINTPADLESLLKEYAETIGSRFSIYEGSMNGVTVSMIRQAVEQYISLNRVKPVVIVDYLQVLRPDDDKLYYDRKKAIDDTIVKLKDLSKAHSIPVLLISSLNRSNYSAPVDFEAFKESGEIEYSSDVVLGLQLECMNDTLFESGAKIIQKRELIKAEKSRLPRRVELVTLKDRYKGLRGSVYFDYYAQFDYFAQGMKHPEYYEDKAPTLPKESTSSSKPRRDFADHDDDENEDEEPLFF